jgi:type I restriction enzyme S subunit
LVTQDLLDQFDSPVTCASFARFLRADPALVDPGYLFWYLQAIYAAGETFEYQVQHTGVARFQYTAFAQNKQIPLPCVSQQQGIAEVLGALDDKIAANTSLTEAADELSRVVFTSMLNNTTSRALSDVADFVNGKAFTKDASGTGRVVIRIAELNSGLGGSTVYNDIDVADQYLARPGDLLFAWSGSLTLHRWFRAEGIINQHIFKVLPKDGYPTWCVNGLLVRKLDEFKGIAADKATTMGHIQRRHLDEPVDVPVAWQIERNDRFMTSLWQRALAAEEESLGLMTMRDALLPQLMSGKIWVRDVAQRVGDVV